MKKVIFSLEEQYIAKLVNMNTEKYLSTYIKKIVLRHIYMRKIKYVITLLCLIGLYTSIQNILLFITKLKGI